MAPNCWGFTAIRDATTPEQNVSLIGVVIDSKPPRQSKGTDSVLEFTIQDDFADGVGNGTSTIICRVFQNTFGNLSLRIMPGDIAIVRNMKLKPWGLRLDCVSHGSGSGLLLLATNNIPKPQDAHAYRSGGNRKLSCKYSSRMHNINVKDQEAAIHLKDIASEFLPQIQQNAIITPKIPTQARQKLSMIKDLEFRLFYDIKAQVVNMYYTDHGTVEMKISDYTSNDALFYYADPNEDEDLVVNRAWKGPFGQLTLSVILWESNAAWARQNLAEGDYVLLKNMRTKMSRANKLEGVLHQDKDSSSKVNIRKLANQADIDEIAKRREAYEQQRGNKCAFEALKNKSVDMSKMSKKDRKELKRQQKLQHKEAEQKELKKKAEEWEIACSGINPHVRAAHSDIPLSTVSEITHNEHLQEQTSKYNKYTLPFVNTKHKAQVRVIDIFPSLIEEFAHSTMDSTWNLHASKEKQEKWEWGFALLVEDANPSTDVVSEKLYLLVNNEAGQELLNQNAVGLKKNDRILRQVEEKLFILWGNLLELKKELSAQGMEFPLPPGDNRLQNKPFECCIEEYGIEVPVCEAYPEGWRRVHRLTETYMKEST